MLSATLLDSYLDAASEISRLAVGDPNATPTSQTYKIPRLASQLEPRRRRALRHARRRVA